MRMPQLRSLQYPHGSMGTIAQCGLLAIPLSYLVVEGAEISTYPRSGAAPPPNPLPRPIRALAAPARNLPRVRLLGNGRAIRPRISCAEVHLSRVVSDDGRALTHGE